MPLSWLALAQAGAPPASDATLKIVKDNARKVFGEQPTLSPDGELIVKGAVFKPRKKPVGSDGSSVAPATPSSRPQPPQLAVVTATAVTFPGAVNVLNSAEPAGPTSDQSSDEDDDDVAAGVASYYELMDELTRRFTCDAVRRKIQRFLARKTITQTAFLREIKVAHNSFTKFMSYSGRDKGHGNKTYQAALLFFHEQGDAVDRDPPSQSQSGATTSTPSNKVSRREQAMKAEVFFNKINSVTQTEPLYVYDDCDEVRRKLHELLESKTVTQTALMKHLGVTSNPLRRFLTTNGPREGCFINVYKLAYVMFERLRIAQGQPKSKKRLQTEKDRPEGYSLKRDPTHYYLGEGETLPEELMQRRTSVVHRRNI